jgi:hypothetical protein
MSFANSREIFRGGQNHLFQKNRKNTSILLFWHDLFQKKRKPRSIKGIIKGKYIYRQLLILFIFIKKILNSVFRFFVAASKSSMVNVMAVYDQSNVLVFTNLGYKTAR